MITVNVVAPCVYIQPENEGIVIAHVPLTLEPCKVESGRTLVGTVIRGLEYSMCRYIGTGTCPVCCSVNYLKRFVPWRDDQQPFATLLCTKKTTCRRAKK